LPRVTGKLELGLENRISGGIGGKCLQKLKAMPLE